MLHPQSIKRLSRELNQLAKDPPNGISVVQLSADNFREFIVNLRILEGPYIGAIAHCWLQLSEDHPQTAPYMNIFLGGGFEESGHHHLIFQSTHIGFCIDMLSNSVMVSSEKGTGWNPAYTLTALLVQMQSFIADPDRHNIPIKENTLRQFKEKNMAQTREFQSNGELVHHSFDSPYPPFKVDSLKSNNPIRIPVENPMNSSLVLDPNFDINSLERNVGSIDQQASAAIAPDSLPSSLIIEQLQPQQLADQNSQQQQQQQEGEIEQPLEQSSDISEAELNKQECDSLEKKQKETRIPERSAIVPRDDNLIKQYINCFITLSNAVDDPDTIFGLPIHVSLDDRFRHKAAPLTEFLSYEGFNQLLESKKVTHMPVLKHSKSKSMFKGCSGGEFNYWLPIFMSDSHFKRNQKLIERCIANIAGSVHLPFQSSMVLDVIPSLMNAMFVKIFGSENGKISYFAIQGYVQLYLLLDRFCKHYSKLQEQVDKMVIDFVRSDFNRNKNVIGDFGCFFVILNASSFDCSHTAFLDLLYREQSARQMMWLENNEEFMLEYSKDENQDRVMDIVWKQNTIGHNLLIFTIEAAKYITSPQFLSRIQSNLCVVSENYAKAFVQHTRNVRAMIQGHHDLLTYFGLAHKYDSHQKIRDIFDIAIFVSNSQGYTSRKMTQAEKEQLKPKLAHLSLTDDRIHSLPLKTHRQINHKDAATLSSSLDSDSQNDNSTGILPVEFETFTLEDVRVKCNDGRNEEERTFVQFIDNSMVRKEREAREAIFGKQLMKLIPVKDQPNEAITSTQQLLATPIRSEKTSRKTSAEEFKAEDQDEDEEEEEVARQFQSSKILRTDWVRQKLGFEPVTLQLRRPTFYSRPKLQKGQVNTFYNFEKTKSIPLSQSSQQMQQQPAQNSWRIRNAPAMQPSSSEQQSQQPMI